jgi:O-antigen ligase
VDRPPGALSPWWVLAGLALVAVAGLAGTPAPLAATLWLGLAATVTIWQPANGLVVLLLAVPFLLGEHKTPYFLLEPALVGLTLLAVLGHRLAGRLALRPAYPGALLVFVAAAVVALPLNLRDLLLDLWLFRSLDWSMMLVQGVPDIAHLKYLERVLVGGLAAGLFVVAAQPPMGAAVVAALPVLSVVVTALAAFGLARFFDWIQTSGQYLTLSFWTWQHPDLRLTGVAWNPDYFALFLILTLPVLAALALRGGTPAATRVLGGAAAGLGAVALVCTFQRAAYVAAAVAVGTLGLCLGRAGAARFGWRVWLGAAAVALAAIAVLDALWLEGRALGRLARLAQDENRLRLWQTALRMAWAHPLLGVGTGRYAFFFREYAGGLAEGFGPFWGTAHSLYLHLLAEQGILGLGSFLALFGSVWLGTWRRLGASSGLHAAVLCGLLAALAAWLAYGVVQFTFRVTALVYLAALLAGTAVALAPPSPRPALARRWIVAGLAVFALLLVVRAEAALRRPVSPGYEAGFYRWERQPDGRPARWTRGRAAMTVPVRGRVLELSFRAPIPGIAQHPQRVRIWVDGERRDDIHLATPGWRMLAVPVAGPAGGHALVQVEVDYTFVPSGLGPSRDTRRLGVMMGEVSWGPA